MRKTIVTLAVSISLLPGLTWAQEKRADLAIVVNPSCPLDNLSKAELTKIFKMERTKTPAGVKFIVGVRDTGPERACALKHIYGMGSDAEYDKYFLQAAFAGTVQTPPVALSSSAAVIRFVSASSGAISFLQQREVPATLKVLKVDGKSPGDAGYVLSIQ